MGEPPEIKAIRDALCLETGHQSYSLPRRKYMAEHALEQVFRAIDRHLLVFGAWEQHYLQAALTALRLGQYDEARIAAVESLRPPPQRVTRVGFLPHPTLDVLKLEFHRARFRPLIEP